MSHFLNSGKRAIALASVGLRSAVKHQVRHLNVHEYVGIKILSENGVNVPKFGVAHTPEEARVVASSLKGQ
jgi:hypothetical protein